MTVTPAQEEAIGLIMCVLIDLPWEQRADVFDAIQFNDVFCPHCGYGSEESPNKNCQCMNDE